MTTGPSKLKRRPIRGAIFGLLIGISTAAFLIMYAVIAFGTWTPTVVVAAGVVLGILWGMFGPAKRRQLPPSRIRSIPTATTAPGDVSGTVQDSAEAAGEAVGENAAEAAESAKDATEGAADSAKGAADSAKGAAADAAELPKGATDATESALEDLGDAPD